MRLYLHHLYARETETLEGTEEQLDAQLAERYPEQAGEVDPDEEGFKELIEHINHEIQGVDIELEEIEPLGKAQTPPDFPKLGIHGNRRETPFVTQAKALENKQRLMTHNAIRSDPDYQNYPPEKRAEMGQRYHRQKMDDLAERNSPGPRGAVTGSVHSAASYVRAGPQLHWQEGGFKEAMSTKNHEDFHQMMKQVEQRHGLEARLALGSNLLRAIPIQYRVVLEHYHNAVTGDAYKDRAFQDEEKLARLYNWSNSSQNRNMVAGQFENVRGRIDADKKRKYDIHMKRALRALRYASEAAHEKWLTPGFIKSELQKDDTAVTPAPVKKPRAPRVAKPPPGPNLVAIHNLTAGNVQHANKLGGLAAPSLAITHKDHPLEGFGDISLVAHHSMIDPAHTPVYESDIYSPRHPRGKYRINAKEEKKFSQWYDPYAKRLGNYRGDLSEKFERGGAEGALDDRGVRNALGLAFFEEQGKPIQLKMKPKNVYADFLAHPVMQEFRNDTSIKHDRHARQEDEYYKQFSDKAKQALTAWSQEHARTEGLEGMEQDLVDTYKDWWDPETGLLNYGKFDRMHDGMMQHGQSEPDTSQLFYDVDEALKDPTNPGQIRPDFQKWAKTKLQPLEGEMYLPKYSDSRGWTKKPYNLHTVLKEMTRKIRQGEDFNYGLGTARAAGAKRFKSLEQLQNHRHKIVPKEQFKKMKDAMDERFGALSSKLSSYHEGGNRFGQLDALAQVIGESYKRGHYLHNELRASGFNNVPLHVQEELRQFSHDLLNMPTEYFEAKPQRAVQFNEFRGAVVPVGTDPEVLKILQNAGLQIEHYKKDDETARRMAIQKVAADHQLMLSEEDVELDDLRKAQDLSVLPELDSEEWPDGKIIKWRASPFPYRRYPALPARLDAQAKVEMIPLDKLYGSQTRVTEHGVKQYLENPKHDPPFVYAEHDGTYTMRDGHHRAVAAQLRGEKQLQAKVVHVPLAKKEDLEPSEYEAVEDQHGFRPHLNRAFAAARFLTGQKGAPNFALLRQNLMQEEGDIEAAALLTYGLPVTDQNRNSLRAVSEFKTLAKSVAPPSLVVAGHPDAEGAVKAINAAIKEGDIEPIKLGGVHSAGTMLVSAQDRHWLLKPGAGDPGPAAGAQEQPATDSKREAAFYHVAKAFGIDDLPRADLVLMNGREYAAIEMLPFDWKNLSKLQVKHPQMVAQAIDRYRRTGQLHQWAVLDFVLGNPDRHGQNEMVSPEGEIKLIDHGSAFAGPDFDPARDKNSFIPYYLRSHIDTARWKDMTAADRLRAMPTVGSKQSEELKGWASHLDASWAQQVMESYGVDAQSALRRLDRVKHIEGTSFDDGINGLWVTL